MSRKPFVHLHVHSHFSLLDGCIHQNDLVAKACSLEMSALALTDPERRFSHIPSDIKQELQIVEAAGTKTLLIAADPGKVHLLSASEIEPALRAGHDRAMREAERIKAFCA